MVSWPHKAFTMSESCDYDITTIYMSTGFLFTYPIAQAECNLYV